MNLVQSQIVNDINSSAIAYPVADTTYIDPTSNSSLYIEIHKEINGQVTKTGSATGFLFKKKEKYFLITNWHVVKGRNPTDNSEFTVKLKSEIGLMKDYSAAEPDYLKVFFHGKKLGNWIPANIPLYDKEGKQLWLEHLLKQKVDVVALPLEIPEDQNVISLYTVNDLENLPSEELVFFPSTNVSIIGFPLGFSTSGKFPIWKTGQIASDYDINIAGLPMFYIDAATRGGMSGSPVFYISNTYTTRKSGTSFGRKVQKFMGIYSGRLPKDSDIGFVWKTECLNDIIP